MLNLEDNDDEAWALDAVLDPWCLVPLDAGFQVLFGYALQHPRTGGLSWLASTEVEWIAPELGRARTRSGRRYELRRRILPHEIPQEGEEAHLSFSGLLGSDVAQLGLVPAIAVSSSDLQWVRACKIGRHLGVTAPVRVDAIAVNRFIRTHEVSWMQMRAQRGWG